MLQHGNPQNEYIWRAAMIEDEIRKSLVYCLESKVITSKERLHISNNILPKLLDLNNRHFGGCPKIKQQLCSLNEVILNEESLEIIWNEFLKYADSPGNNFGTWAI